jgi:hypothetical protein
MKILSLGDVHGRDSWMFQTHGSSYEYNLWKTAVEHGADPLNYEFWQEHDYTKYDKIIFVGDYVDSYDKSNEVILKNLQEIIYFKKALGDRVVLLLGNHDIQYIVPNEICSGFRGEMQYDLKEIFENNIHLFKIAHLEKGADGSKWLWSHAGVTSGWYEKDLLRTLKNERMRFRELLIEFFQEEREVDEVINKAYDLQVKSLWNVDSHSGGMDVWAGPVWVRPYIMNYWPLEGYNQIMGHTPQAAVWEVDEDDDGKKYAGFKHYYIDTGNYESCLIIEI